MGLAPQDTARSIASQLFCRGEKRSLENGRVLFVEDQMFHVTYLVDIVFGRDDDHGHTLLDLSKGTVVELATQDS